MSSLIILILWLIWIYFGKKIYRKSSRKVELKSNYSVDRKKVTITLFTYIFYTMGVVPALLEKEYQIYIFTILALLPIYIVINALYHYEKSKIIIQEEIYKYSAEIRYILINTILISGYSLLINNGELQTIGILIIIAFISIQLIIYNVLEKLVRHNA